MDPALPEPKPAPEVLTRRASRLGHLLGALLLAAALVAGGMARRDWPPVPLVDPDVWSHIGPAFHALAGDGFQQTYRQPFTYPALVWLVLKAGGGLETVGQLQFLGGLLTGVAVFVCGLLFLRLLPADPWVLLIAPSLSALAAAVVLLHPPTIALEAGLRSESLSALCLAVATAMTLAMAFPRQRLLSRPQAIVAGAVATVCGVLAYQFKPGLGLGLPVLLLPWLMRLLPGCGAPWIRRLLPLVSGAVAVGLLVILPAALFHVPKDRGGGFLPLTLLTVHAEPILATLQAAPEVDADAAHLREALAARVPALRRSEGNWSVLGLDADLLLFDSNLLPELADHGVDEAAAARLGWIWYGRAWLARPGEMLEKIRRQLARACSRRGPWNTPAVLPLAAGQSRAPDLLEHLGGDTLLAVPQGQSALQLLRAGAAESADLPVTPWVRNSMHRFADWAFPVSALATVASVLMLLRARRAWAAGAAALLWLQAIAAGNALTIALTHTFDITRYLSALAVPATIAAAASALWLLALLGSLLPRWAARGGHIPPPSRA